VAQGKVLEGELAVAAEQEGVESKQVDLTARRSLAAPIACCFATPKTVDAD